MENATVPAVRRSCPASSIGSQHHIPEQARYSLKTDYPKQSRMLAQTTPTQQSVQQKPRGGKLDRENSWKRLRVTSIGMCLSRSSSFTTEQEKTAGPHVRKGQLPEKKLDI